MISVLPQAAGDKAASFCMQVPLCNTETKALFLPCQDVVRIKKYINDSWIGSYYGNMATWLCGEALRPYLPRLEPTFWGSWYLPVSMRPAAKGSAAWTSLSPSIYFPLWLCHGAKDGVQALGTQEVSGKGTLPWMFPIWRWDEIYRQPELHRWDYTKDGTTPKSRFFRLRQFLGGA